MGEEVMSAAMFTLRKVLGSNSRCLAQRSIATSVQRHRIRREPTYLDTCGVRSNCFAIQQRTFLQFNSYFSSTSTLTDDKQIVVEEKDNSQSNTSESLENSNTVSVEINIDTLIENVSKEIPQKLSYEPRETANSRTPNNIRAGDWVCGSCQFHNFSYRVSCYKCRTSREGEREESIELSSSTYEMRPTRRSETRAGDWNCNSCGFNNFAYRKICFKCNNDKRNHINTSNDLDIDTYSLELDQEKKSDWHCYDCNTTNFKFRTHCFKCNASKSVMTQLAKNDSKNIQREGDWVCPDCQFMNFAWRTECMKCRLPKQTE